MKRILVTGAAGFIGMHLCRELLSRGCEVVGVDNVNDYYSTSLKEARISELSGKDGFRFERLDICDKPRLEKLFAELGFDVVCNLAAQAGVRYSIKNPDAYVQSNVVGFLNVLECCRNYGPSKLLYASSSSVYGGNKKVPFSEEDRVDCPVSLYAATKKTDELMAHVYSHLFGIQTIGLRFFTVYGPWGRPDMALWLFTEAILAGRPIKVFNYGDMKRDFTYIDDIISGVAACIFSDRLGKCEVLNIGNNKPEPLMKLISVLGNVLGVEPVMEMLPMQPGDVPVTAADISKISRLAGFKPVTSIEDGIPSFVAWYRRYHGI